MASEYFSATCFLLGFVLQSAYFETSGAAVKRALERSAAHTSEIAPRRASQRANHGAAGGGTASDSSRALRKGNAEACSEERGSSGGADVNMTSEPTHKAAEEAPDDEAADDPAPADDENAEDVTADERFA